MSAAAAAELHVLSAGAAQGLVAALAPRLMDEEGVTLRTTFGAVGAIREKFLAGDRCDVLILTESMINQLASSGYIAADTSIALGRVRTGIGVRAGDALPDISDRSALKRALCAATDIFLPDPQRATAGIHFAKVLRELGINDEVASRLRPHPNGSAAMAAMAHCTGASPIGCTQVSEIKFAHGVTLVSPLPEEFELATVYSVAVSSSAEQAGIAQLFVRVLCDPAACDARTQAGFEP